MTYVAPAVVLLFLAVAAFVTVKKRKLTAGAALGGTVMGGCIFLTAHYTGLLLLATFFVAGTLATSWRRGEKQKFNGRPGEQEARKLSQVIANGGVAALCGLGSWVVPEYRLLLTIMLASALSTATADTMSSELGTVYGKQFFNITTFKQDSRGLDGVISVEGLVIGIGGSCLIALLFILGYSSGLASFVTIVVAGTLGNISDSILGAVLERKQLLTNDAVNFAATLIGAFVGAAGYFISERC